MVASGTSGPPPAATLGDRDAGIYAPPHRRLTLGIVCSIFGMAFQAIGVATAFPVVARELHGYGLYALGFSAFFTTSMVGMVVAGDLCDRTGPRIPVLAGGGLFAAGLVLAGCAPTMAVLIAGRAAQGLGTGMTIVAVYVVIARGYPDALRPRMFAALSSAWVLPSLIGPALAGWLADQVSWRWVFLGVIPVLVPALLLVAPQLAALDADRSAPHAGERRRPQTLARPALAAAVAGGAGLLQYAGTHVSRPGILLGIAGAALLAPALSRLLPAGTLRAARGLPSAVLLRGLLAGAFFGAEVFVPLMLVEQRGLSTTLAGFSLTGAALGWTTGSWYQGRPRAGASRVRLVATGTLLVAAGIALVGLPLAPALPAYLSAAAWTVGGLGMGLSVSSLSVLVLELSPAADAGANSAALQLCDAVGSIAGITLAGAVFAASTGGPEGHRQVFVSIWAVLSVAALAGRWLAPRVAGAATPGQPASRAASTSSGTTR